MACSTIDYTPVSCPANTTMQFRLTSLGVWQNTPIPHPNTDDEICIRCVCNDDNSVFDDIVCVPTKAPGICSPCQTCDTNCNCIGSEIGDPCGEITDCTDGTIDANCNCIPTNPCLDCQTCDGAGGCTDDCEGNFECVGGPDVQDQCVCLIGGNSCVPDNPCEVDGTIDPITCECVGVPCGGTLEILDVCVEDGVIQVELRYNTDCPNVRVVLQEVTACAPAVLSDPSGTVTFTTTINCGGGSLTYCLESADGCVFNPIACVTIDTTNPPLCQ